MPRDDSKVVDEYIESKARFSSNLGIWKSCCW